MTDRDDYGDAHAADNTRAGRRAALVAVRATVHLPGGPGEPSLRPGDVVTVDPTVPYIQECLRAQTLVPLPALHQPG